MSKIYGFNFPFYITTFLLLFLNLHILNYLSSSLGYYFIDIVLWLLIFLLFHNLINYAWGSLSETSCSQIESKGVQPVLIVTRTKLTLRL